MTETMGPFDAFNEASSPPPDHRWNAAQTLQEARDEFRKQLGSGAPVACPCCGEQLSVSPKG